GSALPLPPPVDEDKEIRTAIPVEVVKRIADAQVSWPQGFTVHPRVKPVLERRTAMASEGGVDWAFAELLAFGSLLLDGRPVRLAGQDSRRGTFVQRHSVLIDRVTGEEYTPLAHLDTNQAKFWVYDSLLSEFAAMGFEYGYSVANPAALVLWEAQFGDFVNGAQSVIDEFISSGEVKWGQRSSVTLLLPHGYEGQGPDHSSARLERFLQVCADENMTVAYPSSPANYFHLLRRQALTDLRKPMVVMTPKSMLRLKAATSAVEEFTEGAFQPVMGDPGYDGATPDPKDVRRVLLCAGKVCYDLAKARAKRNRQDVAIVRVEQLYPLPAEEILAALDQYPNATEHIWVQEEPANQGSWSYIALNLGEHLPPSIRLRRASRKAAAAPAVGSHVMHEAEQQALLDAALG
ncbi:MAG: multifunctional oxoglutarate decarboxylase/oxoglutarate dehydrogenase thiamine pyrophosphate-binding subunit/dihydrolipoyllysine-residue succinyltransferase subunit, partial [Mycobacteriales bacterium]